MEKMVKTLATAGLIAGLGLLVAKCMPGGGVASGEDFHPIKEAEMPKGFPPSTPVGDIEVKHYPAYRKATASGVDEFWRLFGHIKQNNLQMTAPVEMDYGDPKAAKNSESSMSFLYERPDQGATGKQGSVNVVDVPPMTVLSIGCRGPRTAPAVNDAKQKLLKWLAEKKADYVTDGSMRVMGYNSPFVPPDKNFFEVQIPIRPVASKSGDPTSKR